jgi:hypothetical protein
MVKVRKLIVVFLIFCIFGCFSSFGQSQTEDKGQTQKGWSSVDNVFIKPEMDILVKKPMTGPIKIGFTSKEVQEVMGVPDRIDEEGLVYYYRQSPIYFNEEWKVQSWDNRYGNLDVQDDVVQIKLGSHVLEVFKEKDFPLRITKVDHSYQLEYPDAMIFIGEGWQVEAIQDRNVVEYQQERVAMTLDEFLREFESYLTR